MINQIRSYKPLVPVWNAVTLVEVSAPCDCGSFLSTLHSCLMAVDRSLPTQTSPQIQCNRCFFAASLSRTPYSTRRRALESLSLPISSLLLALFYLLYTYCREPWVFCGMDRPRISACVNLDRSYLYSISCYKAKAQLVIVKVDEWSVWINPGYKNAANTVIENADG